MFRVFSDIAGYNTTTILGSGWFLEKTLIFGSLPPKREMIFNIYMRKKRYPKILDHIIQRPYSTRTRPATRYFFNTRPYPTLRNPTCWTLDLVPLSHHGIPCNTMTWDELTWHDYLRSIPLPCGQHMAIYKSVVCTVKEESLIKIQADLRHVLCMIAWFPPNNNTLKAPPLKHDSWLPNWF